MNKCTHCEKPLNKKPDKRSKTGNVFCNSTCAAAYNNSIHIKRKAKHHCTSCNKVIWGGSFSGLCGPCYKTSFCLDDKTLAEATENRKDNNRYTNIRAHARRAYLESDRPKCCQVCGYDKHFEIAHMKKIADYPKDTLIREINTLDKLVALCRNHHWEFDHELLKL